MCNMRKEDKMKKELLMCLAVLLTALIGCKKETITEPSEPQNLIANSSFEINGNQSIDGWIFWSNISSTVDFSNDVPASGGNWSVVLAVGDRVGKHLQTKVVAPVGQNRFRLSVWAKAKWTEPRGNPGFIVLALNGTIRKSLSIQDSVWKHYEAFDTLTTVAGDSMTVKLDAGDAYGIQQTYFDLCRLELLK